MLTLFFKISVETYQRLEFDSRHLRGHLRPDRVIIVCPNTNIPIDRIGNHVYCRRQNSRKSKTPLHTTVWQESLTVAQQAVVTSTITQVTVGSCIPAWTQIAQKDSHAWRIASLRVYLFKFVSLHAQSSWLIRCQRSSDWSSIFSLPRDEHTRFSPTELPQIYARRVYLFPHFTLNVKRWAAEWMTARPEEK